MTTARAFYLNNAEYELASGLGSTDLTASLVDSGFLGQIGAALLTPGDSNNRKVYVPITLLPADESGAGSDAYEVIHVVGASGNDITIERAFDSTSAQAWPAGTKLQCRFTAAEATSMVRWGEGDFEAGLNAMNEVNIGPRVGGAVLQNHSNSINIGDGNVFVDGAGNFDVPINIGPGGSYSGNSINIGSGGADSTAGGGGATSLNIGGGGATADNGINIGGGGAFGDNAVNFGEGGAGTHSMNIGSGGAFSGASVAADGSISIGSTGADQLRSVVIGNDGFGANGAGAVCVGYNTSAALQSVAIGDSADTDGDNAVAIGYTASAPQNDNIAIGNDARCIIDPGSVAIGAASRATFTDAVALGKNAQAGQANSVALGADAVVTQANQVHAGDRNIEIGSGTSSRGLHLYSPDGTRYLVTVANGGTIDIVADAIGGEG